MARAIEAPSRAVLEAALGPSRALWELALARLAAAHGPLEAAWSFTAKTGHWALRLRRGPRTVVTLVPREGFFLAGFALGEKACAAARASRLPAGLLATIATAPRYAEGRAVRLAVRTRRDLDGVLALAAVRLSA